MCYAFGMDAKRPFSKFEWLTLPEPIRDYISSLEKVAHDYKEHIELLKKRIEKLEAKTNTNSNNSNKPPSSDGPFKKPKKEAKKEAKKKKRKRGGQKGHKGHQQKMLEPTEVINVMPHQCNCGSRAFDLNRKELFYTHQHIELPEIPMEITHYHLHGAPCKKCGKMINAVLPQDRQTGYGPRFSALVAELTGIHGASRQTVQDFCQSVLGVPISTGAIQKIIDRSSKAIKPAYEKIGDIARKSSVNYIDETSWLESGVLKWLWTMVNHTVAFFMVHPHRSKAAFDALIDDWRGILVSDNYGVYVNWINKRQTCLAHYIRKAEALCQRSDESVSRFGEEIRKMLQLLCHFAKDPPSDRKWTNFYSQLILLLILFENADDEAGKLARSLSDEMDSLWVFLDEHGVEPTNNRAERSLRFGVIWRKRSFGTRSDKGNRWVERILSVKHTCRQKSLPTFPILVDALSAYFKEQKHQLAWLDA